MNPVKTEIILKHYTYKDISDIIMDYTYNKCIVCNNHTTDFLSLYDDNYICSKCVVNGDLIECQHCKKLYVLNLGVQCLICKNLCKLFCNLCKKKD